MKKKFKESEYPVFEIVCDDTERTGIRLLSIVHEPAIEMMGVAFNKTGAVKDYQFKANEDKQMIIGPAMVPNKKILRKDEEGNYYYNVFKPETIVKLVQKFNSQGSNRRINVDHSNRMVDAYIMENWIVEDQYYDKSKMYGFNVPVGTWMVSIKIEDSKFWKNDVKELGKFGFSIEGVMGEKPLEYSKVMTFSEIIDSLSADEVAEVMAEFKKWRSRPDSASVKKLYYNDETKELVIQFNGGDVYTYEAVEFDQFRDILEGNGVCRTEGKNKWGEWYVGKSPSVGAAVYEILVEGGVSYRSGGSFY
jgi:hypothetical protein